MSEFRKDPVINRWVIATNDRNFTPEPGSRMPDGIPERDELCPFCPGNEEKTGKEIFRAGAGNSWSIRVIPNNTPYLKVEPSLEKKSEGIYHTISGTGANEVIIESELHNADLDSMDINHVTEIIKAYRHRMLDLKNDMRIEHVLIFKNRGPYSGSNILHLHSQLMAMPVTPGLIGQEMFFSSEYFSREGSCVYCDMIKHELESGKRVISENKEYLLIAPFASHACFEMMVLPKKHSSGFHNITDKDAFGLAEIMKDAVTRMNRALNNPSYSYVIHSAPLKDNELKHYHWHIEIMPRVKQVAGFELGSGFYINPVNPEEAAEYLKKYDFK